MFSRVPSIDSTCFFAYVGFIGDQFFLLSTDSTYSCVPGDKGHSFYIQIGVLQFVSHVQFYAKLNVSN